MGLVPETDFQSLLDRASKITGSPRFTVPSRPASLSLSRDEDLAVRTIIGEAKGEGEKGWEGVADVIRNRATQSGKKFSDVVLAPGQFEPWGSRRQELESYDPNSSIFQQVARITLPVLRGERRGPAGDATHFYGPKSQAALGRPAPSWDNGKGIDIGNHRFFNLGYSGKGVHGTEPNVDLDFNDLLSRAAKLTQSAVESPQPDYDDLLNRASQFTGSGAAPEIITPTPEMTAAAIAPPEVPAPDTAAPPPPVPETPDTIAEQRKSAIDPKSPRAAVLTTLPEQNAEFANDTQNKWLQAVTPNGTLWVDVRKARKLKLRDQKTLQQFVDRNPDAMARLIGKVDNVGNNTAEGVAVSAIDPHTGTELTSSIVTNPDSAEKQIAVDQASFPGAKSVITDPQAVIQKRTADREAPAVKTAPGLPIAQKQGSGGVVQTDVADTDPAVRAWLAAHPEGAAVDESASITSPAVKAPTEMTFSSETASDDKLLNTGVTYSISLRDAPKGQRTAFAVDATRKALQRDYGLTAEQAQNVAESLDAEVGDTPETIEITVPRKLLAIAIGKEKAVQDLRGAIYDARLENLSAADKVRSKIESDRIPNVTLKAAITPEELTNALVNAGQSVGGEIGSIEGRAVGAQVGNLAGSALGGVLGSAGRTAGSIGGILDFINDLSPTKGESMAQALDPDLQVARPDDSFRDILKGVEEAGEQAEARMGDSGVVSQIVKVAGATPGDLSRLILLSRLPGGMISGMALDSAAQTKSRGGSTSEVLKSAGHGGVLGALFSFAPSLGKATDTGVATLLNRPASTLIKEGATLGTIGGGTYALASATGSEDPFREAVVNSVFHLTNLAPQFLGRPIRVRDEQGNIATAKVEEGTVKTVVEESAAEIFVPKDTKPLTPEQLDTKINQVLSERKQAPKVIGEQKLDTLNEIKIPKSQAPEPVPIKAEAPKPVEAKQTAPSKPSESAPAKTTKPEVPENTLEVGGYAGMSGLNLGKIVDTKIEQGGLYRGERLFQVFREGTTGPVWYREKEIQPVDKDGHSIQAQETGNTVVETVPDRSAVQDKAVAADKSKLPPHLQEVADKAKNAGFIIEDVTPEGYGPSKPSGASPYRQVGDQRTTEANKLQASINEAKTLLKGKLTPEKRTQIERGLASSEGKLSALGEKPLQRSAEEIESDYTPSASKGGGEAGKTEASVKSPEPVSLKVGDELFSKNKVFTPDKIDAARAVLKSKGTQFNTGIDPESFKALVTIAAGHIEAGARKFTDFSARMVDEFGEGIKKHLSKLYDQVKEEHGFDGMEKGISAVGKSIEAKAIEKGLTRAFDETAGFDKTTVREQAEKMAEMLQDPERVQRIISGAEKLPSDIRGGSFIKAVEEAALEKSDAVTLEKLAKSKLTSETSVHAQEMRMLAERDPDSVVAKIQEVRKAREQALKKRGVKIDELEKRATDAETKLAETQTQLDIAREHQERLATAPLITRAEQIVAKLDARAEAARERLRQRGNVFTSGIDPAALKDLTEIGVSHIAHIGLDFAKWSKAMVKEFGEQIRPHLNDLWDKSRQLSKAGGGDKQDATLKAVKTRLQSQIDSLQKQIDSKVKSPQVRSTLEYDAEAATLKAKRDALKEQYDAIFGKNISSMSLAKKQGLYKKRLELQIAQLDRQIRTGEKAAVKRRLPTTPELDVLKARRDALKEQLPEASKPLTDEQYNKMRQGALEKQIEDLSEQISTKERKAKDKAVRAVSPENAKLIDKRDELKQQFDEIFGTAELTNEQRLKLYKSNTEKRLTDLQSRLTDKDYAPKQSNPTVLDAEALRLKEKADTLRKVVDTNQLISAEEVTLITEMTRQMQDARAARDKGGDRMDYGHKYVALGSYITDLKRGANKLSLADFKSNPVRSVARLVGGIPGTMKAIQASMDDSAIFRQGWKVLWTNPGIWSKNAARSFKDLFTLYGQDKVLNEMNADIVSRPNADLYKRGKLDVGTIEEDFPTTLPESVRSGLDKIGSTSKSANVAVEPLRFPLRVYTASQSAFTAFVQRTRADVFDKVIDIAKKQDIELTDQELQNIGRMVNSLTGRGRLHNFERAGGAINSVLFSPRLLKSHIDTLGGHVLSGGAGTGEMLKGENSGSNFVRKQAAKNLAKQIIGAATVLMIARVVAPDSVELDPRSSDFGKIKVGNTRIEVFGGQSSVLTLAARLAALAVNGSGLKEMATTKSGNTYRNLNEKDKDGKPKFGSKTGWDLLEDFFENKMAPGSGFLRDIARGHRFGGKPLTASGMAADSVTPIGAKNYQELQEDPDAMNTLAAMILDGLGAATNTYGRPKLGDGPTQTREEHKAELQKEVDAGKITKKQAQNRLDARSDNPLVEKIRNVDEVDNIEQWLKVMAKPVTPLEQKAAAKGKEEIKQVLLEKIGRLETEGSPKSIRDAAKLREMGKRYFPKAD